ncbi:MCE family protein [Mycolicibacterium holsaticum]|uniref:MCE family protein n=1 Tax=Mycolicibacterium holsaticum TaxID=152142 RepID=UPI001C7DF6BB|nr:MCE family protein [Mycolicibacterium holsaticum]QZA13613.1 MCE family protein [Mycolicibacterium holsaticum DSM 44478 = JCM 12374]UNC08923.1 MCE family protein [Mycolicibacterium holsaticum DSM 44478 = JCM 12374]
MPLRRSLFALAVLTSLASLCGCDWRGLNSLPMPGTAGGGSDSYVVRAELPDVVNIQQNSRVRVGDVTVGNVTKIEIQDWHALVTMTIDSDVELPANATATVGQTSLLGTMHIELAAPTGVAPEGKLRDGALIPLPNATAYPTTEQTLAAISLLLNGGGIGQIQDITEAFSTAFRGRDMDLRSLLEQLDRFIGRLDGQKDDILAATESLNRLTGQFAGQRIVMERALRTIPDALAVLRDERRSLADALDRFGEFSALAADAVDQTKEAMLHEFEDIAPALAALGDAGPALTRSLSLLTTFPWPKENIPNWIRGDYANSTLVVDLTLSRIDSSFFTGTRWEGDLTELEIQWGRTIGQLPSPYTGGNPLVAPYHWDQGQ